MTVHCIAIISWSTFYFLLFPPTHQHLTVEISSHQPTAPPFPSSIFCLHLCTRGVVCPLCFVLSPCVVANKCSATLVLDHSQFSYKYKILNIHYYLFYHTHSLPSFNTHALVRKELCRRGATYHKEQEKDRCRYRGARASIKPVIHSNMAIEAN